MANTMRTMLCTSMYISIGMIVLFGAVDSQGSDISSSRNPIDSSTASTTTVSSSSADNPTTAVAGSCAAATNCDSCLKVGAKCLWCGTGNGFCTDYPVGDLIPRSSLCKLSDARWGTCSINYEALLISMGVIGGIIFLAIFACCCYCCCCKSWLQKRKAKKYRKEDARVEHETEQRRIKHDERRAERKTRMDEIRKKYALDIKKGLVKEDNPYQRFDA